MKPLLMKGDPGVARTLGPLIKSQLLYQLSYGVSSLPVCNLQIISIDTVLIKKPVVVQFHFFFAGETVR